MIRKRSNVFLISAIGVVAALALAACSSTKANPAPAPPSTSPPSTSAASVSVAQSGLGSVLVNSQGLTLYLFQADSGTTSACFGACAAAWPPLRVTGQPTPGNGVTASLLGTTPRSDGNAQVTYNGHPLYLYVGDKKAGDTSGQGVTAFGGGWFALSPAGAQVTAAPSSGGGSGAIPGY